MSLASGTATKSRGLGRVAGAPAGGAAEAPGPADDGGAGVAAAPGRGAVVVEEAPAGGPPEDGVVVAPAVGAGTTAVARRFAQPSATRGTVTTARTAMGANGNRAIESAPFGGHVSW